MKSAKTIGLEKSRKNGYALLLLMASFFFATQMMAAPTTGTPTGTPNTGTTAVNFFDGDFVTAKTKAGTEGKLFFLDFYADWCMPCKWMDQTTFRDNRIAGVMNDNYVAIKLDIDKVEGFELKNKYEVQYLPTILIFNSKGKLIDRIEETMPANRLLAILESHNSQANKVQITYSTNTAPGKRNESPTSKDSDLNNKDLLDGYASANQNRTFRLQMGVYDDYENAFKEVSALKEEFIDPVIVLNDYHNGGVRYKIMMSEFETLEEAEGYRKILKRDFGRDCIVQ